MSEFETNGLTAWIWEAIHTVNDPEFGVPIDDLGLIYDVAVRDGEVSVVMTLTTEHCPAGEVIVGAVKAVVEKIQGVRRASVAVVWDPKWTPDMLSAHARELLGWV